MRQFKVWLASAGLLGMMLVPTLRADQWNEKTKVTFDEPVEIPGAVLPAGTYIFKLLGSETDRNIVEIWSAHETELDATVLAVPDERLHPTGKTVIKFAERRSDSPAALKAWFYPGDTYGLKFVYPHDEALELAKANKESVFSTRSDLKPYVKEKMKSDQDVDAKKMKSALVKEVSPSGEEKVIPSSKK
ncbi:MAG TPA: hypothetical protein VN633_09570 [Bryobacteraceae bacterium]|nr:hypothetical protein [Bryobacteraceae bacterium]